MLITRLTPILAAILGSTLLSNWANATYSSTLTLLAQACIPCVTGCLDSNGCEPGSNLSACGNSGTICQVCGSGQACFNQACCTPTTCAAQGKNCDTIRDGCGGTLNCGTCSGYQTCGGGGSPNVCGCTPTTTCDSANYICGVLNDGCGNNIYCGVCDVPYQCSNGSCICPPGKNCQL